MSGTPKSNVHSNVHNLDAPRTAIARNAGIDFEPDLFGRIRINRSAVERRAATIGTRRSIKRKHQAAWLLKAVACIDLTTLAGDDTPGRVRRLCQKARRPIRADLLEAGRILEEAALDKYVFQRDAYLQRRRSLVYDGRPPRERFE